MSDCIRFNDTCFRKSQPKKHGYRVARASILAQTVPKPAGRRTWIGGLGGVGFRFRVQLLRSGVSVQGLFKLGVATYSAE